MRNLGHIVALCLAVLLPTNSLALGLGEIEVKSFLNQPLNAEIEVISARPGEIDDLLVSLASREAFTRAGLSRPRYLSDLRFQVRKSEEGDEATIIVTTKDAVKEPFLNFLIEADWSKGRVLREFTVLLDPPFFADQPPPVEPVAVEPVTPIEAAPSVAQIAEQAGVTPTQPAPIAAEPAPTITEPIALSDTTPEPEPVSEPAFTTPSQNIIRDDVLVVRGDTLWSIASRVRAPGQSMSQVMLAFQRANPRAFNDGNINNMKVGAVLRVPDAAEIQSLGQREAYAEVLVQNGLWEEYVARVTGRSTAVAVESAADDAAVVADSATESDGSGELSLLVPGDGSSESAGSGDPGEIDELRTKLALAEEELDAARIENVELESRITELQARLSKLEELQKMIEIEDDSLAQLQAGQAQVDEPGPLPVDQIPDGESEESVAEEAAAEEAAEIAVNEQLQSEEEALLEELLAEEAAAQAEEDAARADQSVAAGSDFPDGESEELVSEQADDSASGEDSSAGEMVAEVNQNELLPPPAPVIVTEPVSRSPSMFDGILPPDIIDMIPSMPDLSGVADLGGVGGMFADPIILAALGGVVLLLLVLLLVKRRRGGAEEESGIMVSDDGVATLVDDDEELTPVHLVEDALPEEIDTNLMTEAEVETQAEVEEEVEDLAKTAVISAVEMPEPEAPAAPAAADGAGEQDDVLNEVDVYLAYGLYDNAEELLNSNIAEHPERADYRSKLLDTYFATQKVDAFVKEAENLKSMGEAGAGYWDRVQVMGYELAPNNPLFSDAKDSGLSAADLEIAKPQEADFDLGSGDEDDTNFSTTDFQLGEEDTDGDFDDTSNAGEAGNISATQQIDQIPDLPQLDDDEDTNIRAEEEADTGLDLPDEIGEELEFSMDDGAATDAAPADADLDLTGELNLDTEFAVDDELIADDETGVLNLDGTEEFSLDSDFESMADDDAVELAPPGDDETDTATAVITPNYEETEVVPSMRQDEAIDDDASDIDLGMDDTMAAIADSDETGELSLDTGDLTLPVGEEEPDDDEDISIIDFGGDDFVEPTDVVESLDEASLAFDVDMEDEEDVKTGTFAPGDFDEPTAATPSIDDIDDIGDLMLPDDVDEVSTKLDLARAFIDMGDTEGARGSLEEVISEGNEEQKAEAKSLLAQI